MSAAFASVEWFSLVPTRVLMRVASLSARHARRGRLAVRVFASLCDLFWDPEARCARLRPEVEKRLGRRLKPALWRAVHELLKAEGLVVWDAAAQRFAFPDVSAPAEMMARHPKVVVWKRPVAVYRKQWQQIAATRAWTQNADLLLLIARCSWRRKDKSLDSVGRSRVRQAAAVAGSSRRSVQRGRSRMEKAGALARVDGPQDDAFWAHGPRMRLLAGGAASDERSKLARGGPRERSKLAPTRTNTSGSGSRFNEHPDGARSAGAARTSSDGGREREGPLPRKIRIRTLQTADLKRREVLEEVYAAAVRAKLVSPGTAGLSEVAALAARALRPGTKNPPGYLRWLLQLPAAERGITLAEEDRGRSLLRGGEALDLDRPRGGRVTLEAAMESLLASVIPRGLHAVA